MPSHLLVTARMQAITPDVRTRNIENAQCTRSKSNVFDLMANLVDREMMCAIWGRSFLSRFSQSSQWNSGPVSRMMSFFLREMHIDSRQRISHPKTYKYGFLDSYVRHFEFFFLIISEKFLWTFDDNLKKCVHKHFIKCSILFNRKIQIWNVPQMCGVHEMGPWIPFWRDIALLVLIHLFRTANIYEHSQVTFKLLVDSFS